MYCWPDTEQKEPMNCPTMQKLIDEVTFVRVGDRINVPKEWLDRFLDQACVMEDDYSRVHKEKVDLQFPTTVLAEAGAPNRTMELEAAMSQIRYGMLTAQGYLAVTKEPKLVIDLVNGAIEIAERTLRIGMNSPRSEGK